MKKTFKYVALSGNFIIIAISNYLNDYFVNVSDICL